MKRWTIHAPSSSLYEEAPDGEWVSWQEVEPLVEALRAVQHAHSRAFIELSPALERNIADLIGLHPRDGGEP